MSMEALSDEVMLRIFAPLSGTALLDVVPLVCKRWQKLSRDPRAWEGVAVWGREYCRTEAEKETPPVDARVLLHAPAVRRINIGSQWDRWMVSAFTRSKAVVLHKLYFDAIGWKILPRAARVALLDMLWRSRDCVREVHSLQFDKGDEAAAAGGPLRDSEGRSPLAILAQLKRLHALGLDMDEGYPYARELAAGFPELRELQVNTYRAAKLPELLTVDLLTAVAPTLRDVDLHGDLPPPPVMLKALSKCKSLRQVRAHDKVMNSLRGMQHIEEMTIFVWQDSRVSNRVKAILEVCQTLGKLFKLNLNIWSSYRGTSRQVEQAECKRHIRAYERKKMSDVNLRMGW
ncbi:uncharacterized protein LOC117644960 [Thrips palmi]|uniref:Uncharacterized protein LOC117644960 n=1 Tax=Thrips palmi TaxID=161013 RepID=A0A6P8YU89_THRPL|nr:uncharacterized protein LOC117644960 [Thrips palmi]